MVKLTENEKKVFRCMQLRANLSLTEAAKICGLHAHSVRNCLQRILELGIAKQTLFINPTRLGFTLYGLFFSVGSASQEVRTELLNVLKEDQRIAYIAELGGEFDFEINIISRHVRDVSQLMDELSSRFKHLFFDKAVVTRLSFELLGSAFLAPSKFAGPSLRWEAVKEQLDIDEIDHNILSGLITLENGSHRELARRLGVSISTLEYRIKRLEKEGVLLGHYYILDPAALGYMPFVMLIKSKGMNELLYRDLQQFCLQHPNIDIVQQLLGSWDFQLLTQVQSQQQAQLVYQDLLNRFSVELSSIKLLPEFSKRKIATYPFRDYSELAGMR